MAGEVNDRSRRTAKGHRHISQEEWPPRHHRYHDHRRSNPSTSHHHYKHPTSNIQPETCRGRRPTTTRDRNHPRKTMHRRRGRRRTPPMQLEDSDHLLPYRNRSIEDGKPKLRAEHRRSERRRKAKGGGRDEKEGDTWREKRGESGVETLKKYNSDRRSGGGGWEGRDEERHGRARRREERRRSEKEQGAGSRGQGPRRRQRLGPRLLSLEKSREINSHNDGT